MSTTHQWLPNAPGAFMFDPANYVGGATFASGDSYVYNSGTIEAGSATGAVATLPTGSYDFNVTGAQVSLTWQNIAIGADSKMTVTGPGPFKGYFKDDILNSGSLTVGTPTTAGSASIDLETSSQTPPVFENQGAITVNAGSTLALSPTVFSSPGGGVFFNAAGATLTLNGGTFSFTNGSDYSTDSGTVRNDGVIQVNANSNFHLSGAYTGAGVLNVSGTGGASALATVAHLDGPANGVFNISSGVLDFADTTVSATGDEQVHGVVNFLDNNGALVIETWTMTADGAKDNPFGATINGFQAGDVIEVDQSAMAVWSTPTYDASAHMLYVYGVTDTGGQGGVIAQLNINGNYDTGDFTLTKEQGGGFIITTSGVCFAAGTLIRTPRGDVAVERLARGDLVVTASGEWRPVKWLGHRAIDCTVQPDPRRAWPVRIAADAFGPGKPSQDLFVSSGHAICVDLCGEVFIHAGNLVNGATITQVEVDSIEYWHVELDSHDVLLANALPAESFLPMANRHFFADVSASAASDGDGRTFDDFCRPVVQDGPILDFVRQRLRDRAEALGWTISREADLWLSVDGETIRPSLDGTTAVFRFSAQARDVALMSNTFIASWFGAPDTRELGVQLRSLLLDGPDGAPVAIALDDPLIAPGLHSGEASDGEPWRWTKGALPLPARLWDDLATSGEVVLRIPQDGDNSRRWLPPEPSRRCERRSA